MKRRLTHCDIKQDRWYKVVRPPDYWENKYQYGVLNKVGKCRWINPQHGVSLIFDGCLERIVPPYCLEPVGCPEKNVVIKEKTLEEKDLKIGDIYLVAKTPEFYDRVKYGCPVVGKFGVLKAIRQTGCLLTFDNENEQHFVPFDCLQETGRSVNQMIVEPKDEELISKIIENPLGVLKIIRGLAKMNKDTTLRNLIERGVLV